MTAERLLFDYDDARLSSADLALCDWAVRLTLAPGGIERRDLDALWEQGFSDEQVGIATQVIAFFNYTNRVANGLGVEPEPWMELSQDEWRSRKRTVYPIARA